MRHKKKGLKGLLGGLAVASSIAIPSIAGAQTQTIDDLVMQPETTQIDTTPVTIDELKATEDIEDTYALRVADSNFFNREEVLASGEGVIGQMFNLFWRSSGRTRLVQNLGARNFGHRRPNYEDLDWTNYETQHFRVYTYDETLLEDFISYSELCYDDLSRLFGNRAADLKTWSYLYHTRRDFEQSRILPYVPEGLGGVTMVTENMKYRVLSLFEGDFSDWKHVWKHEYTHWHDIQKMTNISATQDVENLNIPLWLIEGTAEYVSTPNHWDAEADAFMRNAFMNGFFLPLDRLWIADGTWLMYKEGQFITKFIADEFGENAIIRLRENMGLEFEDNVKASLGITMNNLQARLDSKVEELYGHLRGNKDIVSNAVKMKNGAVLAAHNGFFITGAPDVGQNCLYAKHVDELSRVSGTTIVCDRLDGNDSLHNFRSGADIDDSKIVYAIRNNDSDVLRVVPYAYDREGRDIDLGDEQEFKLEDILVIKSPRIVDEERVAFIGHKNGFAQVFMFNTKTKELEQLTEGRSGYNGIDCHDGRLVISKEDRKAEGYVDNLYIMDLSTRQMRAITDGSFNALAPRFSPDGKRIAFVGDENLHINIYMYDIEKGIYRRMQDANIAALSPQWLSNDEILFNSLKGFSRTMHRMQAPSAEQLLRRELLASEETAERAETRHDAFTANKDGLFVSSNGITYKIGRIAANFGAIYMEAMPVVDNNPVPERLTFLRMKGGNLENLVEPRRARQEERIRQRLAVDSETERFARGFEESHTVLKKAISKDGRYLVFAVNNRLSFREQEERAEIPFQFYIYDSFTNTTEARVIPDLDSTHQLKEMAFVDDVRMYFDIGRQLFLEADTNIVRKPFSDRGIEPENTRISEDGTMIAAICSSRRVEDMASVCVYDAKTNSTTEHGAFDESQLASWGFTTENRLVASFNIDEGLKIVYENNNETQSFFVPVHIAEDDSVASLDISRGKVMLEVLRAGNDVEYEELYAGGIRNGYLSLEKVLGGGRRFYTKGAGGNMLVRAKSMHGISSYVYDGKFNEMIKVNDAAVEGSMLVVSNGSEVRIIDLEQAVQREINSTLGFDVKDGKIAYARFNGNDFDIFEKDLRTGRVTAIAATEANEFLPSYGENSIEFKTKDARIIVPYIERVPDVRISGEPERREAEEVSSLPFESMQIAAIGAYSGSAGFLAVDLLTRDNLFERMFMLNFIGDFHNWGRGAVSYADIDHGFMAQAYVDHYISDLHTGAFYRQMWDLNRSLHFDLTGGYEFQRLQNSQFDFWGDNHVLKLGLGLGYDNTFRSREGPIGGYRAYLNIENGYSVSENQASNIDVNGGIRAYYTPHELVTIAGRAEAGFSFGMAPTLYLLGGNQTLRGVPFGSEAGNNFFLSSLEVRSPLIEIAGAILSKPLTPGSVFFVAPGVELGVYCDVGSAWYYNPYYEHRDERNWNIPFELRYDTGMLINLNTIIGRLRFNVSFLGNEWGFWFGGNW
ncbi:MAG: DPP IV N-terminal domain-containing protein [Nanoarchaeota archaeon]|nr:DPP IV N-terminal domain-containing protein [Nanoarchaeota archaeon]